MKGNEVFSIEILSYKYKNMSLRRFSDVNKGEA